jgi:hypothetical protein
MTRDKQLHFFKMTVHRDIIKSEDNSGQKVEFNNKSYQDGLKRMRELVYFPLLKGLLEYSKPDIAHELGNMSMQGGLNQRTP